MLVLDTFLNAFCPTYFGTVKKSSGEIYKNQTLTDIL